MLSILKDFLKKSILCNHFESFSSLKIQEKLQFKLSINLVF